MCHPRFFFEPLAEGAPEPLREVPSLVGRVDVLANLEDAVPRARMQAARQSAIEAVAAPTPTRPRRRAPGTARGRRDG